MDDPDAAAPVAPAPAPVILKPDAGVDGPGASQGADAGPLPVDPEAVRSAMSKSGESSADAPLGLRFEVVAPGPDQPWVMALINRGTEAALVDFDARLLAFDVELPPDPKAKPKALPKKPPKPHECRLPADVVPTVVEEGVMLKLEPGDGLVQNFDPRLYCLPSTKLGLLVPGAKVTPRFGWPIKTKVLWRAGKRVESQENQLPPFVAEPAEAEGSLPSKTTADGGDDQDGASKALKKESAAERAAGKETPEPERRVKELRGTPFELGAEFAPKPAEPSEAKLSISVQGSDSRDEDSATATVTMRNRSKSKLDLYFRRELVTFEVAGPDGVSTCDPEPDLRSPDRQAFTTLRPGGEITAVSRLMEMCPAHTFARPGLYMVHARFDSASDGSQFGLHAFTGRVASDKPGFVRIRRGPLPFMGAGPAQQVRVGGDNH